ncbi:hypothetical protein QWJ41_06725 [Nocardioides sp. SOB44]|uniref:3-ketosteroid-9-alpha-monooxygenase oxygenase component-like C-terminal domain-containing protein n=1 Tax=Nocardioides cremeus TaxID=3058044 RepID=A0ABT8TQX6_9ACTN|nr:hypothetical protein [Nocardioides cremeus]MDO3395403.1 hypothetical protein [Nocardioides cremeus]
MSRTCLERCSGRSEIFASYSIDQRETDGPDGYRRRLDEAKGALPDDLAIRNRQVFVDPLALATSEGRGFRAIRRWADQFFPADAEHTLTRRSAEHRDG